MKNKFLVMLILISSLVLGTTVYGAWGGGGCKPASSASRASTKVAIDKGQVFGGYVMSGFKTDYFVDETVSVFGMGNWYNQSISKKYKLNGILEGFGTYEDFNNSLITYGATVSLNYNNWLSFPVTYTIYDYGKTANQEVLEGYVQIRY